LEHTKVKKNTGISKGINSIFEHILAHINPDGPGLIQEGYILPDEAEYTDDFNIIWPSGIRDLFDGQSVSFRGKAKERKIKAIISTFKNLTPELSFDYLEKVESVLNFHDTLSVVDDVIKEILNRNDINEPLLYQVCRYLMMNTRHRGTAKFCIAITGLFSLPFDIDVFKIFARHEEFTLYSIVAVINKNEDAALHWLDMAKNVTGWGRIHLVERLALSQREDVKEFLLKEGCSNTISEEQTALTIAEAVDLDKVLQKKTIDRDSFHGAGILTGGMISAAYREPGVFAKGLDMYPEAASVLKNYLKHAKKHACFPEDYRVLEKIANFTSLQDDPDKTYLMRWKDEECREIHEKASSLLKDPRWKKAAHEGIHSNDRHVLRQAVYLADSLNIDVNITLFERLEKQLYNVELWRLLSRRADGEIAENLAKLAIEKINAGKFTGYAAQLFDPLPAILECLLDMLYNFPDTGGEIIQKSLEIKSIQTKLKALKVLNNRDNADESTKKNLTEIISNPDEDEMVRICAEHVLNTQPVGF
jgi:hypothetical protein